MREISCKHCGKTYSEAQKEWDHAWQTGTCPACGRFFDSAVEAKVEPLADNIKVMGRARARRTAMISSGLLFLLVAFVLARLHLPGGLVIFCVVAGVPTLISGLFYRAQNQARRELMRTTDLDKLDQP